MAEGSTEYITITPENAWEAVRAIVGAHKEELLTMDQLRKIAAHLKDVISEEQWNPLFVYSSRLWSVMGDTSRRQELKRWMPTFKKMIASRSTRKGKKLSTQTQGDVAEMSQKETSGAESLETGKRVRGKRSTGRGKKAAIPSQASVGVTAEGLLNPADVGNIASEPTTRGNIFDQFIYGRSRNHGPFEHVARDLLTGASDEDEIAGLMRDYAPVEVEVRSKPGAVPPPPSPPGNLPALREAIIDLSPISPEDIRVPNLEVIRKWAMSTQAPSASATSIPIDRVTIDVGESPISTPPAVTSSGGKRGRSTKRISLAAESSNVTPIPIPESTTSSPGISDIDVGGTKGAKLGGRARLADKLRQIKLPKGRLNLKKLLAYGVGAGLAGIGMKSMMDSYDQRSPAYTPMGEDSSLPAASETAAPTSTRSRKVADYPLKVQWNRSDTEAAALALRNLMQQDAPWVEISRSGADSAAEAAYYQRELDRALSRLSQEFSHRGRTFDPNEVYRLAFLGV